MTDRAVNWLQNGHSHRIQLATLPEKGAMLKNQFDWGAQRSIKMMPMQNFRLGLKTKKIKENYPKKINSESEKSRAAVIAAEKEASTKRKEAAAAAVLKQS